MMIYKLICVVVLCFIFDGATAVVGEKCGYGVCRPLKSCQSVQSAHSLGLSRLISTAPVPRYAPEKVILKCKCKVHRKYPQAKATLKCIERAVSRSRWRRSVVRCPKYLMQITMCSGDPHGLTLCNSSGKEILVCCYDNYVNIIPHGNTLLYGFNIVNIFWPTASTSKPGYRPHPVSTNPPQWTTASTSKPGYGSQPVATNPPWWTTASTSKPVYRPHPVGTNPPWWTTTSTSTPGYGTHPIGTNPPQWPTASTAHHGWPTTSNTTSTTTTARAVATTSRPSPTTTEYMPPVYDYIAKEPVFEGCRELDPKLTTNKTGRPAWDKCVDYQQQLVYPCQRSVTLLGNMVRVNNCAHAELSSNQIARSSEFPHMVVLGVKRMPEVSLQWACTATLISERFILSSAYCLGRRNSNDLYAAVGFMQRLVGNTEAYQEYKIESITFYDPRYNGYSNDKRYHDIALLKTATEIRLNQWVIPACLDVFGDDKSRGVATRWRARSWDNTNLLQKEFLHRLSKAEYRIRFRDIKYNVANQVGYGNNAYSYDNCQFDNEGSLTVENHLVHCMYTVVAVFSNATAPTCGSLPSGSYTRVSDYTSWIEQIVWPGENEKSVVWGS